ncbi:glycosyltransferase family 1 protein [Brasilonema octagenarum UFV-E1]|uniref:Glycosyltransferase family 1 protein n=1 Tax=Brasilonema sennae CENA114 TaxID=415709 RepID=A0A856MR44_9CYAN|nr:glycosyltransferase family 1 protein [Brasilonema sennae]QDL11546.1 glycosyltransferase family 1 protein [Brasilonema sennae CENA114]QDL17927.1 glycosyltransferase family 1 protein [Brasilonema octagenarum UFV-E1]
MSSKLRIIVTGLVGLYPVGGVAWDYLQYVIGLAQLGHDVYYHEDTWSWPYHPLNKTYTSEGNYSAQYIRDFFNHYAPELLERWHYLHLHSTSFGMNQAEFDEVARTADVFLNVSGACIIPDNLSSRCVKIFLDTDPGYNQLMLSERFDWSENVERWCTQVAAHDQHFTYAENIYSTKCIIPKVDFEWKTTRMPVVMDLWEQVARVEPPQMEAWTTVMTWNAFKGKLVYKGVEYKSKGSEFEKVLSLPQHTSVPLKVAVGGVNAPLARLANAGWNVVDGPTVTLTPESYQKFIANSRGELSSAKHVYVAMSSGWFSCRSACYLAGARPVVVQDTGFTEVFPVGEGLLTFKTQEEAVAAIHNVEANYTLHAKTARDIAYEYFDSEKVLRNFIEKVNH